MFSNPELNNIYKSLQNEKDNLCVICMEELAVGVTKLECNHQFHTECLKNSFNKYESKRCPYCRKLIKWDNFKNNCLIVKRNKIICNKVTFSTDHICSYHTKLKLKKISKIDVNKVKEKKNELKQLNAQKTKINKNITSIKTKINNLISQFVKLQDDKNELTNKIGILQSNINGSSI